MTVEAEVICDSISPQGQRLTTMKLRYPKFIHGEFMTHRVFSRNASSSRAIPVSKSIEEVRSDALRAAPVFWGKNQKGMQAAEELEGDPLDHVKDQWGLAAQYASECAEEMLEVGLHKQIVNRILEPFLHINVVVTATEWGNFFDLRLHKDAQPEMRALAQAVWKARRVSMPKLLELGEWHLPFVDESDRKAAYGTLWVLKNESAIKVSVARCARVSYESFETGRRSTVEEDLALYERLVNARPAHLSPCEHQATPDTLREFTAADREDLYSVLGSTSNWPVWENWPQHGNFVGWRQYRKMLPGEAVAPLPEGYA